MMFNVEFDADAPSPWMVGALVPDWLAEPNEPCPALPRPTTAGTERRICWTDWALVFSIESRLTLIRFEPTGATPLMLDPVTMIS